MQKRKATVLALLVIAGTALFAVWGGPGLAAGKPTEGVVNVYEADTSLAGNLGTVVLTGAITDQGTDHQGVPQDGVNQLVLSNGSFSVNVNDLGNQLSSLPVDPNTCSFSGSVTAPITIVAGSGRGAYKGIKGTIETTGTEAGIWPRDANGQCNTSVQPTGILLVQGSGNVSYR
jgi:hypothetical protein